MKELNKDKIKVTRPVYLYLIKNKIYKQFIKNCKKYHSTKAYRSKSQDSITMYVKAVTETKIPSVAIMNGFQWTNTPEGVLFWSKEYDKA